MKIPQKKKKPIYKTTIWYSNPIPGHVSRENQYLKRHMHPRVHYFTLYNSQDTEAT